MQHGKLVINNYRILQNTENNNMSIFQSLRFLQYGPCARRLTYFPFVLWEIAKKVYQLLTFKYLRLDLCKVRITNDFFIHLWKVLRIYEFLCFFFFIATLTFVSFVQSPAAPVLFFFLPLTLKVWRVSHTYL